MKIVKWVLIGILAWLVYRWVRNRWSVAVEATPAPPAGEPADESVMGSGVAGGIVMDEPSGTAPAPAPAQYAPVLVYRPRRLSFAGFFGGESAPAPIGARIVNRLPSTGPVPDQPGYIRAEKSDRRRSLLRGDWP